MFGSNERADRSHKATVWATIDYILTIKRHCHRVKSMLPLKSPDDRDRRFHAATTAGRVLLGSVMFVVGILKLARPGFKVADDVTLRAFIDSGWLWQLIGAAEVIGGAALLSGAFVPLGLAVLAPVVAGITAFAVKVGGEEASVGFIVLGVHLALCWAYRSSFAPLLARRP